MKPTDIIHTSWLPILSPALSSPIMRELNYNVLPNISFTPHRMHIFRAFSLPVDRVRAVLIGQDPYPGPGDAIGYSFAIDRGRTKPKSLQIIEREITRSDPLHIGADTIDLLKWPEQGILMLNASLTTETGKRGSHRRYWQDFTAHVVKELSRVHPCTWILWGNHAKDLDRYIMKEDKLYLTGYDRHTIEEMPISSDINYVMKAPHPMVEAYGGGGPGFYGCDHFYFVNRMLARKGQKTIIW